MLKPKKMIKGARTLVRKALTPTKKLSARDKAQRQRTVKAARAASDKGRPSNPTDPAARIARRAVKEDEAKKLDQKLDRQSRVQAKRTQRVGERRVKAATKAGKKVGAAGVAATGAGALMSSKDSKPQSSGTTRGQRSGKKSEIKKERIGTGNNMYMLDGRLNISKDNLDATGMTITQYANYMKKNKKRPPKAQKKMGGGMMKSKMASKGGARGGKKMMPGGMKNGGTVSKVKKNLPNMKSGSATKVKKKFPDLTGDGRVTQADILKGRGVAKKRNGGMMKSKGMAKGGAMTKKGMAKGGAAMKKKGYAKGGMAKKGYSKGGAVRGKPRGVGVALRGYGKALKK